MTKMMSVAIGSAFAIYGFLQKDMYLLILGVGMACVSVGLMLFDALVMILNILNFVFRNKQ